MKMKKKDADFIVDNEFSEEQLIALGLNDDLCTCIKDLSNTPQDKKNEYRERLSSIYFDEGRFQDFCEKLYDELKHRNYYAKNFFVHRLATAMRATNYPMANITSGYTGYDNENAFVIVDKINDLIKGVKSDYR